jgi:FKBP-type peptidyl-prolyl cis-trans isomerase SlyD
MAIKIKGDCVVKLVYRLTDTKGQVLEERTPEHPYEYLQGHGQILPALEKLVEGKTPGFRAELQLGPRDGYGEFNPSLVTEVSRTVFPHGMEITQGMKFSTQGPHGQPIVVRVLDVNEKTVTVDGNHPLAGIEIIFELRVLDVREATPEEIENGRVDEEPEDPRKTTLH